MDKDLKYLLNQMYKTGYQDAVEEIKHAFENSYYPFEKYLSNGDSLILRGIAQMLETLIASIASFKGSSTDMRFEDALERVFSRKSVEKSKVSIFSKLEG